MGFFYNKITSCGNGSAIDPSVLEQYQTKTDSNLTTSDKTIVGAINDTSTQINNINTQINSTISEADINTIINNALK